jgi:hypothetical protein
VLASVDALALVAFVLIEMRSHREGSALTIFGRNAVPLLVCWFGAALLFRTYLRPGVVWPFLTWLVSTPIALLVRTALFGSPTGARLALFVAVAMAFTLLFLAVGRAIASAVYRVDLRSPLQ